MDNCFRRLNEIYPSQPISQIRINELVSEAEGMFGDRVLRQVRVLEKGKYCIYRRRFDGRVEGRALDRNNTEEDSGGWVKYAEGTTSLDTIPLAITYSNKISELISKPPLLPIAHLNILRKLLIIDAYPLLIAFLLIPAGIKDDCIAIL